MPRKIIIDTDPGIDDAMAIFYALAAPELEVIGLTSIFGNGTIDTCTQNALRLVEIAGQAHVPVARGAAGPLDGSPPHIGSWVHGDDGQGNQNLPPPQGQPHPLTAAAFIIEQVMSAPGQVTLVPLGPLTNLALALHLEPRLASHVQEVVLMGGNAFVPGNRNPTGEANIASDPEAADVVFGADWPIVMVGLDVTHKVLLTDAQIAHIGTLNNPRAQHMARILPFYRAFYGSRFPHLGGIYLHDSTTITYLLAPELFETVQYPIKVETQGVSRGKTWPGTGGQMREWAGRRPVTICTGIDGARAVERELAQLATP